jgi:hypothetical protein
VAKGLASAAGQKPAVELAGGVKSNAPKVPVQSPPTQTAAAENGDEPATVSREGVLSPRGNVSAASTLVLPAKEALPESPPLNRPLKTTEAVNLFNKLTGLIKSLDGESAKNPVLARALKALDGDPAVLSSNEKKLLHTVFTRLIKENFQDRHSVDDLERALSRLSIRSRMPLDKETAALEVFSRLLKGADSLPYSRMQVQEWANSLRELADGMVKTTGAQSERSSEHIQTSFVFNLATEGQERHTPVYINIYHERGGKNGDAATKSAETWLRINVAPEYVGQVAAIFHLYQESLLDVKIVFANPEGMREFNRFLPDIEDALQNASMRVNSITVV